MIEARDITIKYGEREVVRNVSFDLSRGKMVALLGANGAGKSTLIKALNGLVPIAGGEVLLDGKELGSYSRREAARKLAVVAQENETRFPVKVLEFVLGGRFAHGSAFGWESEEDVKEAVEALEMCDLAGYEDRAMNEISGGERQRAVLARALATGAEVMLLDEPTANLDIAHQAMMFELVRKRCVQNNYGAVVITHDLNLASEFADEIVVLKNGRVVGRGRPEEVLNERVIGEAFGVKVVLDEHPVSGKIRVSLDYR